MGDELLTNRAAFPSAVLQIRKMLVAATPLANPLALTCLPSEQTTPVESVSHPKTPVLAFEGKVKQQVKSRKRTSKKSKVKNRGSNEGRISAKAPNFCVFWVSMAEFGRNSATFLKSIITLEK